MSLITKKIEFMAMEKKHTERWSALKKEFTGKKIDLKTKQCLENTDLCIQELEDIKKNGYSEELIKKYLEKKIALHEKHIQEREQLCHERRNECKKIIEQNAQERERFKKEL